MTRVKICGITNLDDALCAVEYGADALGFIFEKTSPRYIGDNLEALEIPNKLPPFIHKVAVYAHADNVREYWENYFDSIQFITNKWITGASSKKLIQAFQVRDEAAVEQILQYEGNADAILLDAWSASAFGGTGHTCDWQLARKIRDSINKPLILAGGLNPDNVQEAIHAVRPYAVDVSSGVELKPGIKDHAKIKAFIRNVRLSDENNATW